MALRYYNRVFFGKCVIVGSLKETIWARINVHAAMDLSELVYIPFQNSFRLSQYFEQLGVISSSYDNFLACGRNPSNGRLF